MTGNEVRKSFIDFFKSKEHKYFESASLIPDDKTLLLTVAGMVPFKSFFLGEKKAPFKRITTYQKCIRTNDLENVGFTPRHQTFFEMLGNFSFGDYFKKESIEWSWEYITEVLKMDENRLWVSVFETDDESFEIWNKVVGVPTERIVRLGAEDNWWSAGPIGSCGPCSEIYYDTQIEDDKCPDKDACKPGCECDRFLEIWNLVFTEWNKLETGELVPLPEKNIDTGAGLERITSVMQGKRTNFETDLFQPIIKEIEKVLDMEYKYNETAINIIADHTRAAVFLISDGILPSNEGRGYVLRKLIRRAFGMGSMKDIGKFDKDNAFLYKFVSVIIGLMKEAYPELVDKKEYIEKILKLEEERFTKTLRHASEMLMEEILKLKNRNETKLSADISFKLYDTYGFPFEFIKTALEIGGLEVSEAEFKEKLEEQVRRSQGAKEVVSDMIKDEFIDHFYDEYGKTNFLGYEEFEGEGKILHLKKLDGIVGYEIIFDKTIFYAESGGQVSDKGIVKSGEFEGQIVSVIKKKDIFIHRVEVVKGMIPKKGDILEQYIDSNFRKSVQRNHTATHILHKVLREVLGTHVEQSGSLVEDERLRFDFSHFEALSNEQIKIIEEKVNNIILNNTLLSIGYENIQSAKDRGAVALFSDKYGNEVRVVEIPGFSIELCGGTHVKSTGEIGLFNIESETGIASGVRRITATTGIKSLDFVNEQEDKIDMISDILNTDRSNVVGFVKKIKDDYKSLTKVNANLLSKIAKYEMNDLVGNPEEINGIKIISKSFENKGIDELKEITDMIKDKLKSCVILLGANNGKAVFVSGVTKDLINKVKAGDIVRTAAKATDGSGGGKPDFAQAGGKNGALVDRGIEDALAYIKGAL